MFLKESSKMHVSVDCVIFGYNEEDLQVLLMKSDMKEFSGQYSLVGKILNNNQTLHECAQEVLFECTKLSQVQLQELGTYSDLGRHPLSRVVTVAYYSLLKISEHKIVDSKMRGLEWVSLKKITGLAFDHERILKDSLTTLRTKMEKGPIGLELMPEKFTIHQLQKMYESVFDSKIDKRNFRRRLFSQNIIIDIKQLQEDVSHRPAKLYSFNQQHSSKKKIL